MHCLWDLLPFRSIDDYESWERELLEDNGIQRHAAAGHLVPINIHSDGAFAFVVRVDPGGSPALTSDEERRVVVSSDPYLFRSTGTLALSGIEHVHREPEPRVVVTAQVESGDYEARVFLMDYDDIPDKTENHPDFILLIGRVSASSHRTSIETFPQAPA